METKQYIEVLKKQTKEPISVAMRQAVCYYLYRENIPCSIIASVLGRSRRLIYMYIYRARDLMEVGDSMMLAAVDERKKHHISIRPYTIDGGVITRHAGYKMIIDNIIY